MESRMQWKSDLGKGAAAAQAERTRNGGRKRREEWKRWAHRRLVQLRSRILIVASPRLGPSPSCLGFGARGVCVIVAATLD